MTFWKSLLTRGGGGFKTNSSVTIFSTPIKVLICQKLSIFAVLCQTLELKKTRYIVSENNAKNKSWTASTQLCKSPQKKNLNRQNGQKTIVSFGKKSRFLALFRPKSSIIDLKVIKRIWKSFPPSQTLKKEETSKKLSIYMSRSVKRLLRPTWPHHPPTHSPHKKTKCRVGVVEI